MSQSYYTPYTFGNIDYFGIYLFKLGVKFANCGRDDYCVISTSVDQMIKMWNIKENQMAVVKEIFTDVADVSNLEVWCEGLVFSFKISKHL